MSLKKAIDFKNGVITDAAYIEVSNANIDFTNKTVNFNVKTYLNKEVKDAGLGTILPDKYYSVGQGMNYTIPPVPTPEQINPFETYFASGDLKTNCETYLLTLPEYSDCTIIAE